MFCFIQKDNLIVRHYGVKLCLVVSKRVARTLAYCHDNHTQLPDGFVTSLTDVIVKVHYNAITVDPHYNSIGQAP